MTERPLSRTTADLRLPDALRDQLTAWAFAEFPREGCGLLLGTLAEGTPRVTKLTRAKNLNVARAHDRYELDPQDFLAAEREARALGLEVLGIWHSHPNHSAEPSETDRDAAWEGWSYVIVAACADGGAEIRSWRLDSESRFREEVLGP